MPFPSMRRSNQVLDETTIESILTTATSGVLALSSDNGYPYALPLSFVYDGQTIYFHCAKTGHKIDCIHNNNKASFCIIARDDVHPETYTTYYQSVIIFGTISIIDDATIKKEAIVKLAKKYAPIDTEQHRLAAIEKEWKPLCMLKMDIDHITGKCAIELKRQQAGRNQ